MAMTSLADRLQAVTSQKKQEEFMTKSYEELSRLPIAFGEAKVGMTYLEVIEKDPKYAQWLKTRSMHSGLPASMHTAPRRPIVPSCSS